MRLRIPGRNASSILEDAVGVALLDLAPVRPGDLSRAVAGDAVGHEVNDELHQALAGGSAARIDDGLVDDADHRVLRQAPRANVHEACGEIVERRPGGGPL